MKKVKDAVKRQLKEQWKQSCNGFLVELLRMWELDAHYGYWIGDETGSVYDYGDGMFTINMDDIIYCVLADVTREQYIEWQEYICDAAEFGFSTPNLRSFVLGCPRTSAETFKHLREIKTMLNDAIQDEKERVAERDAKQKIDCDDVDPNHLVHEHIDEPDPKTDIKAKRIEDCNLSVFTTNICKVIGIDTLGDLCKLHKTDWLKFRNGGKKSLAELDDLLHDNGLDWAE